MNPTICSTVLAPASQPIALSALYDVAATRIAWGASGHD